MDTTNKKYAHFLLLCFVLCCTLGTTPIANPVTISIQVDGSFAVGELVKNIFSLGVCDNITNVKAIGNQGGIGYFENGAESIGFESGIVLSTGPIQHVQGPNSLTDMSGDFEDERGDPDLDRMASNRIKDAVGIEFDFIPLDSFVAFRYVFASEEYCEFVGSIYNDVFGFFISGPGINGPFANNAKNVALLPGTNDFVSINNVNHLTNSNFYIGNELAADADLCNKSFNGDSFQEAIEFDGFTQALTAFLKLSPCETYHIRMVVADVGDAFYDSAVFLEAGSFNIGGKININGFSAQGTADAVVFEGCTPGYIEFSRAEPTIDLFPLTVNFKVLPSSTAQVGTDFAPFSPASVMIPPGQTSVQFPITVFNDQTPEDIESIVVELDIPCACYTDTARVYIADAPLLELDLPDIAVCSEQTNTLTVNIEGGVAPFTYNWSTGDMSSSIEIPANGPSSYQLTVTDDCGTIAVATNQVQVTQIPSAQLAGYANICEGDTAYFRVDFTGVAPWHFTLARDGQVDTTFTSVWNNPFYAPVTQNGTYELFYFEDAACAGSMEGSGRIDMAPIEVEAAVQPVRCFGGQDGAIEVAINGGVLPLTWEWSTGATGILQQQNLPAGPVDLHILDAKGCTKTLNYLVTEPSALAPLELNCEAFLEDTLDFTTSGGTPPYQYSINAGNSFTDDRLFDQLASGQWYNLLTKDANDCQLEQRFFMPKLVPEVVKLPEWMEVTFGEEVQLQPLLQVPAEQLSNIRWVSGAELDCIDCLMPSFRALGNAELLLKIQDINGCRFEYPLTIEVKVEADYFVPNAFSPNNDGINDRLVIFANPYQVEQVLEFKIFDRWGGACFAQSNFPPNTEAFGWDGRCNGRLLSPGVYVFMAQLQLIDGQEIWIKGSSLLIK